VPSQWAAIVGFSLKTLLHERAKSLAGLVGVAFAVCLALVQLGMYIGAMTSASAVIDRSTADLWVVPRGAQNFDFTDAMPEHLEYLVRSAQGVEKVERLVVVFGLWQLPTGGMESVEILGFDLDGELCKPWNVSVGDVRDLRRDRNIFIDGGDLKKLHVPGVGGSTEIYLLRSGAMKANIVGLTEKVKSFVASPMVMTSYKNALAFAQRRTGDFTYLLVKTSPGWDPQVVKANIMRGSERVEAYTKEEFAKKTQTYWDQTTGLGIALFASAALGILIGVGTVAMILYMSTIDHLGQYATLKALGVPNRRVIALVAAQALMVGFSGFAVGLVLALGAQQNLQKQALYVLLTPELVLGVFVATIVFCIGASAASAVKIVRVDPGVVFHT
jgi:putative ABC transport system permease protein